MKPFASQLALDVLCPVYRLMNVWSTRPSGCAQGSRCAASGKEVEIGKVALEVS